MYIKGWKRTQVKNAATIRLIFHDSPRPRPDSMTFHTWKIYFKLHNFLRSVHTLPKTVDTLTSFTKTVYNCRFPSSDLLFHVVQHRQLTVKFTYLLQLHTAENDQKMNKLLQSANNDVILTDTSVSGNKKINLNACALEPTWRQWSSK